MKKEEVEKEGYISGEGGEVNTEMKESHRVWYNDFCASFWSRYIAKRGNNIGVVMEWDPEFECGTVRVLSEGLKNWLDRRSKKVVKYGYVLVKQKPEISDPEKNLGILPFNDIQVRNHGRRACAYCYKVDHLFEGDKVFFQRVWSEDGYFQRATNVSLVDGYHMDGKIVREYHCQRSKYCINYTNDQRFSSYYSYL